MNLRKANFQFQAAFDANERECAIANLSLNINGWLVGEHEFVFAEINEDAIPGLDFFRKYNAFFDFKTNKLGLIDNEKIFELNYVEESITASISKAPATVSNVKMEGTTSVSQNATNASTKTSATTSVTTAENVSQKPETANYTPIADEEKPVDNSNETVAKLPKNCRIAPLSKSLIRIKTTFAPGTDVLFDTARNKESNNQGILWAYSVAEVSEEGKILVTVMNVIDKEVYFKDYLVVGTLSVVESACITLVEENAEKKPLNWQTRAEVAERVKISE